MELWQTVVAVCAGIITVCSVGEKIWKYTRPVATANENIKDTVSEVAILKTAVSGLQGRVEKLELHQDNDLKALRDHASANQVVCKALLALLDHQLNGNHTAQLEDAKDKLQHYLIQR